MTFEFNLSKFMFDLESFDIIIKEKLSLTDFNVDFSEKLIKTLENRSLMNSVITRLKLYNKQIGRAHV